MMLMLGGTAVVIEDETFGSFRLEIKYTNASSKDSGTGTSSNPIIKVQAAFTNLAQVMQFLRGNI